MNIIQFIITCFTFIAYIINIYFFYIPFVTYLTKYENSDRTSDCINICSDWCGGGCLALDIFLKKIKIKNRFPYVFKYIRVKKKQPQSSEVGIISTLVL